MAKEFRMFLEKRQSAVVHKLIRYLQIELCDYFTFLKTSSTAIKI